MRRASLILALLAAAPLHAQELSRIDTLIARSRFTEARAALQRWHEAAGRNAASADAAHALMLRARLASSADSALQSYLEVALTYPATPHAPEALLRLGQGYSANGDHERAAGYLERVVRDYPNYAERATARLWLARAQLARRRTADACRTLQQARADSASTDVHALIDAELAACTATAGTAANADAGAFTIQAGAFRDVNAARALARRLTAAGIDARVVNVGTGTLAMVRAGRFRRNADAAEMLRRVRTIVPDAVIANDAARERTISQ